MNLNALVSRFLGVIGLKEVQWPTQPSQDLDFDLNTPRWDYTSYQEREMHNNSSFIESASDSEARFKGREIIRRDSPVLERVSIVPDVREAIVVRLHEPDNSSPLLDLYEEIKSEAIDSATGQINRKSFFDIMKSKVHEKFGGVGSENTCFAVENLLNEFNLGADDKVSLNLFIKRGIGVCRHRALTYTALLELAKKENIVRGEASFDRNRIGNSGHAWCRYTNSQGQVYILDSMQGYFGDLENSDDSYWKYHRPEELAKS